MALDQVDIDNINPHTRQVKDPDNMSFLDHLEELRWHFIRSLGAIFLAGILVFLAGDFIFHYVVFGPRDNDFLSYRLLCHASEWMGFGDRLCLLPPQFEVIAVEFAEEFVTHIKVSVIIGFMVAFPYVFYEIWKFIRPGLYEKEQKAARGLVFICSILFSIGVLFGYYIISPFAINFLAGYTLPGVANTPSISSYVNSMMFFTLPVGLAFELPVLIYFLTKIGIVTPSFLQQYRRHAFVVILVLAAIITPPDIITQAMIGMPLYILYELSILISIRVQSKMEPI